MASVLGGPVSFTDEHLGRACDAFIVSEVGRADIKGFGTTALYSLDDEARKGR